MFTDSHCHLASFKFKQGEIPTIIARAEEAGVKRMITLSTDLEDLQPNLSLAEKYESIFCCLGIHPCDVTEAPDDAVSILLPYLDNPNVVAVGETGLDYFHPCPKGWEEEAYHARQRDFLRAHFQIAKEKKLNIALHTRDRKGTDSFQDCLKIYREYSDDVRAVFHCFPGTLEQAQEVLSLGGLVSFTGNVTFKNAVQVQETATALPLGTFMLETDAPYLAPVPHRGERNEPCYVKAISLKICSLKGICPAELSKATEKTVNDFFSISR